MINKNVTKGHEKVKTPQDQDVLKYQDYFKKMYETDPGKS